MNWFCATESEEGRRRHIISTGMLQPLPSLVLTPWRKLAGFNFRSHLDVFLVRNRETAVDRGGRGAPVLVELQPHGPGVDDLRDQSIETHD